MVVTGLGCVTPLADAAITTDSAVWKAILTGQRNPALAFASDDVQVDGSALDLLRFLRLFGPA